MNEYLKKENVIHLLEHNDKVIHYVQRTANNIVDRTVQTLCGVVNEMPAEDVQPVKHGRWEYSEKEYGECAWYFCSCCDEPAEQLYNDEPLLSEFCPHCSARMDGDF